MKINNFKLSSLLLPLIAAIGFAIIACSSEEELEESHLIKQSKIETETALLLNEELPVCSYIHYSYGFFPTSFQDTCYVINSQDELKDHYDEINRKRPDFKIDFDHNSLIVGQHRIKEEFIQPSSLETSYLYENNGSYTLKLYYNKVDAGVDLGIYKLAYYWGVYPKLRNKKVVVEFNWI